MQITSEFFYLFQLCKTVATATELGSLTFFVIGIFLFLDNLLSNAERKVVKFFVIGVILFTIKSLIPNEGTFVLMQASKFIDAENAQTVEQTIDVIHDAIDYVNAIMKLEAY